MRLPLPRISLLFTGLVCWLWLFAGLQSASAVHLLGGEMSYKYLDANGPANKPWRYEITMLVYFNPNTDPLYTGLQMSIYNRANKTGYIYNTLIEEVTLYRSSRTVITVPSLPGCGQASPPTALGLYKTTVELPVTPAGFFVNCNAVDRVAGITNLKAIGTQGMSISAEMAPGTISNSSPVFSSIPVALICAGTSSFALNNAYDAEGDELVYSLSTPSNSFFPVEYAMGFNATQPFGAGGTVGIDANTGLSNYLCAAQGVYQLAIDVREYRAIDGIRTLLSVTHRDMQVVVRVCNGGPSAPPAFTAATLAQRDFQIREGETLQFNVAATDPDGHPLTLTASSALLDGPEGIAATFGGQAGTSVAGNPVGNAAIRGVGTVAGLFRLTGCGINRRTPYDVVVTATDEVCNSQTVAAIFHITVVRPAFAGTASGPGALCVQSTATYSVSGANYPAYQWTVLGGQVQGSATGPAVNVRWTSAGPGEVRVNGITDLGCPTQAVTYRVAVAPGLTVQGPTGYCLSAATGLRYTVLGPAATYQWTIADGTIVSGQGTNEVLVDIPSGATATLQVANPALNTCGATLRIGPDDRCLYFYNVITPNGDKQNETFVIQNIERHPNTVLTVFNRWGRKVYHTDDYHNTFGDERTGPGLYYYLCRTADGATYKGWFEVIR